MRVGEDHPLARLTAAWVEKIRLGWEHKKRVFQDDADEAMRFFNGPYDWIYDTKNARLKSAFQFVGEEVSPPKLAFAMTVNKAAELVQIFGPALYHRNPNREVNPRKWWVPPPALAGTPEAYAQAEAFVSQGLGRDLGRASLFQALLDWSPHALGLAREARFAVTEALLKGMGLLWPQPQPTVSGRKVVKSTFATVDDLVIDPDARKLSDAKWVALRCIHPHWEVEDSYGLPRDSLKAAASSESRNQQGNVASDPDGDYNRRQGKTNDLLVYWKVWSKMGAGGRLSGVSEDLKAPLESLGTYCYLIVCRGVGYPLNVPPEQSAALLAPPDPLTGPQSPNAAQAFSWPTPFWADDGTWPFAEVAFHHVPNSPWPMSHLRPGIGELKFLNWAYSMLAGKVKVACRDFLAIAKSAGEDLKNNIKDGADYTVLEIEHIHDSVDKVVKFLQHPEFNADIYRVIEQIARNFEQRTGLTELMYGLSAVQLRSAEEAQVKGDQVSVRPDDMANMVEVAMTDLARKEALCLRWHAESQDVEPILGPMGAAWWQELVLNENPAAVLLNLEYRIEAGSGRKPNRAKKVADINQAFQSLGPLLQQYAFATGNVTPLNSLINDWAKAMELDPTRYMLQPPMPPPQTLSPSGEGNKEPPEGQRGAA